MRHLWMVALVGVTRVWPHLKLSPKVNFSKWIYICKDMYFQMADFNQFVYIGDEPDGRDRKKGTFFGHIFEGQING